MDKTFKVGDGIRICNKNRDYGRGPYRPGGFPATFDGWEGEITLIVSKTNSYYLLLGEPDGVQEQIIASSEWMQCHATVIERSPFAEVGADSFVP